MCHGVFILFTPTSSWGSSVVGVAVQQARAVACTKYVGYRCAHMLWPHQEPLMFEAAKDCFPLTPTHGWIIPKNRSLLSICHCFGSSVRSHNAGLISWGGSWGPLQLIFAARDPRHLSDGARNKRSATSVVAHQYLFNLHLNALGFVGSHLLMNASLPPSEFHVNSTAVTRRGRGWGRTKYSTTEESESSSSFRKDVKKVSTVVDFCLSGSWSLIWNGNEKWCVDALSRETKGEANPGWGEGGGGLEVDPQLLTGPDSGRSAAGALTLMLMNCWAESHDVCGGLARRWLGHHVTLPASLRGLGETGRPTLQKKGGNGFISERGRGSEILLSGETWNCDNLWTTRTIVHQQSDVSVVFTPHDSITKQYKIKWSFQCLCMCCNYHLRISAFFFHRDSVFSLCLYHPTLLHSCVYLFWSCTVPV